jgi:hypothetical protein
MPDRAAAWKRVAYLSSGELKVAGAAINAHTLPLHRLTTLALRGSWYDEGTVERVAALMPVGAKGISLLPLFFKIN